MGTIKETRAKAGFEDFYNLAITKKLELEEEIKKAFEVRAKEIDLILEQVTEEVEIEEILFDKELAEENLETTEINPN
jgi:hypothetical protein